MKGGQDGVGLRDSTQYHHKCEWAQHVTCMSGLTVLSSRTSMHCTVGTSNLYRPSCIFDVNIMQITKIVERLHARLRWHLMRKMELWGLELQLPRIRGRHRWYRTWALNT